jgi:hypothetical protein
MKTCSAFACPQLPLPEFLRWRSPPLLIPALRPRAPQLLSPQPRLIPHNPRRKSSDSPCNRNPPNRHHHSRHHSKRRPRSMPRVARRSSLSGLVGARAGCVAVQATPNAPLGSALWRGPVATALWRAEHLMRTPQRRVKSHLKTFLPDVR